MKTRFSPLVKLKKTTMEKSERVVQKLNVDLNNASVALEVSYQSVKTIEPPNSGSIKDLLANRTLLSSGRNVINHNREWVEFVQDQINQAKEKLKLDTMEHEKFKYLELQEIQKELKKIKLKEAKDLDEVALMTYTKKVKK